MGYHRAGFDVHGVDNRIQKRYPFHFYWKDALQFVAEHSEHFDVIHASPPCHDHSYLASVTGGNDTFWILEATRDALQATGKPYVIENVMGAEMPGSIILCGSMFGLGVQRHRQFESNVAFTQPDCAHESQQMTVSVVGNPCGKSRRNGQQVRGTRTDWMAAMAIDWMVVRELTQAVPPAYTQFVGEQLLASLALGSDS
jgi:DNA (cytosine-5)-methyltransferase 1